MHYFNKYLIVILLISGFVFTVPTLSIAQNTTYSAPASIRGQVHVLFKDYDLPLKQIPVYFITTSDGFTNEYAIIKNQILPLLKKRDLVKYGSYEWISVSESIISLEKKRVSLFRRFTLRTIYADNQGLYVFYDVPPNNYFVFVEGAIKDKMMIWKSVVTLTEGQEVNLDFGSHNVGDTSEVYK